MTSQDNFLRATKYLTNGRAEKALQFYRRETHKTKEVLMNMGNCYRLLDQDLDALRCYTDACDPNLPHLDNSFSKVYPLALCNLGLLHYVYSRDDAAMLYYNEALAADPIHYDTIWNYASALLRKCVAGESSEWATGWQMYEFRFQRTNPTQIDRSVKFWDGVSTGKTVTVLAEQGIGDKIQFGRYISRLREYFTEVYVQCHPSLSWFFSEYKTVSEPVGVGVPICSLARHFGVASELWLPEVRSVRKAEIGIVCSGSPTHGNDRNRSCNIDLFKRFANYDLINLNQKPVNRDWVRELNSKSWVETAQVVAGLDLVITVDTSIAHLAGSLGKECLVLQPRKETDFRWGYSGKSYWYDSVTVIENPHDWEKCFELAEKYVNSK